MTRRTAGRKAYQVLDFITGLEDRTVRDALGGHGLADDDLDRGWELLRGLGRARRPAPPPGPSDAEVFGPLDAWENRWFVIADAVLAAHHPKVHAWLFRGLRRSRGVQVVVGVGVFVERLHRLEQGVAALGKEAAVARALLARRGLTQELVAEAEQHLAVVKHGPKLPPLTEPGPTFDAAEAALWSWYLEWSRIARTVISEPRLLNHLGLGKRGRPRKQA